MGSRPASCRPESPVARLYLLLVQLVEPLGCFLLILRDLFQREPPVSWRRSRARWMRRWQQTENGGTPVHRGDLLVCSCSLSLPKNTQASKSLLFGCPPEVAWALRACRALRRGPRRVYVHGIGGGCHKGSPGAVRWAGRAPAPLRRVTLN